MTLRQEGAAGRLFFQKKLLSYKTDGVEALKFVSSARQNQRVGWLTVVLVAIEASPVGSKPPAAVGERISKSGRQDLDAAAPFSTKMSSLHERTGGSAFTPKQVEVFGSS